jgi:hypothetical protein
MDSFDSTEFLLRMYAAESAYLASGGPGERSFVHLAPFFSPDVVLHQADALPYGGTWHGHEGIERFFVAMGDTWSEFELLDQKFLASGTTTVVHTQIRARSRATGTELRFPLLQTIALDERGIREVHPFYWDTAAIVAACETTVRNGELPAAATAES